MIQHKFSGGVILLIPHKPGCFDKLVTPTGHCRLSFYSRTNHTETFEEVNKINLRQATRRLMTADEVRHLVALGVMRGFPFDFWTSTQHDINIKYALKFSSDSVEVHFSDKGHGLYDFGVLVD